MKMSGRHGYTIYASVIAGYRTCAIMMQVHDSTAHRRLLDGDAVQSERAREFRLNSLAEVFRAQPMTPCGSHLRGGVSTRTTHRLGLAEVKSVGASIRTTVGLVPASGSSRLTTSTL